MKALILIGGYGTRLRPLTLSILKPLVEFCNRPMLVHQIEALVAAGISEIILAIHREAECIEDSIRSLCESSVPGHKIDVHFSYEDEHLGTGKFLVLVLMALGGPLAQAAHWLKDLKEPFFVLNSDIICNYPFQRMLDFHKSHGKEGTMAVTKVEEPSRFGAVVYNDHSGGVLRFVEKPYDFIANKLRPTSIEVEIFPRMVEDGQLYCIEFSGFWMDIGRPEDFIQGVRLYLSHLYESKRLTSSCPPRTKLLGNVLIVRMENVTVLGEDVQVNDEIALNGALVLPHNSISESVFDPQVIM